MFVRWALAISAAFASSAGAETAPVTVNQLDGRSLEEVAKALGPLIVDGLTLKSFNYGPPFTPGTANAEFDYRS